jgi:hypothetical protein
VRQPRESHPLAAKTAGSDEADKLLRPEHRQHWSL